MHPEPTPLGYNITDVSRPKGPLSRSEIYNAINEGRLRAKKYGRRTIITPDAWRDFLAALPDYSPREAA
jgi:hypothetical protein